mmetsp:Transcript_13757/g.22512  ORF Transcript_13757/g.22512 Transcript_13757/m.22512 type:complete len:212 (+) Transcript_13757:707-1342(+)
MDHDGALLGVLSIDVRQLEARGEVEVQLNRGALPLAADGVENLDIDLGPVEGTPPFIHLVRPALGPQRLLQRALRLVPELGPPHRLLGLRRQVHLELGEAEGGENLLRQVQHPLDLIGDLPRQAEDVRIVLREPPHAEQAVHGARPLVPIHRAHLRITNGQIAVAVIPVLVHRHMEGAVHGLKLVHLLLHRHGLVHVLSVEVRVSRGLPQV